MISGGNTIASPLAPDMRIPRAMRVPPGLAHGDRYDRDQRRIDQSEADLLPQRLPRFEIVGEPRQDTVELSRLAADRDQPAIQRRERVRFRAHRLREALPGNDACADTLE